RRSNRLHPTGAARARADRADRGRGRSRGVRGARRRACARAASADQAAVSGQDLAADAEPAVGPHARTTAALPAVPGPDDRRGARSDPVRAQRTRCGRRRELRASLRRPGPRAHAGSAESAGGRAARDRALLVLGPSLGRGGSARRRSGRVRAAVALLLATLGCEQVEPRPASSEPAPIETREPVESEPVESEPVESEPVESEPVESEPPCELVDPPPNMIDLAKAIPDAIIVAGYQRVDNFTGAPLPGYEAPGAWLEQ